MDASLLKLALIGFVDATDERMVATVNRIRDELCVGGLIRRYRDDEHVDTVEGGDEGVFLLCSCWLVEVLALQGRGDEAEQLFERVVATANDVGLFAEEYDTHRNELLGNFPQAFTHLGVIAAARRLAGAGAQAPECSSPSRSPAVCTARLTRHGTDGRPPVLVAASTRPPNIDRFLRNWIVWPERSFGSFFSQKRWPASVVGTSEAASANSSGARQDPHGERDARPDLHGAVDHDETGRWEAGGPGQRRSDGLGRRRLRLGVAQRVEPAVHEHRPDHRPGDRFGKCHTVPVPPSAPMQPSSG